MIVSTSFNEFKRVTEGGIKKQISGEISLKYIEYGFVELLDFKLSKLI